jgi:hypothetical protein
LALRQRPQSTLRCLRFGFEPVQAAVDRLRLGLNERRQTLGPISNGIDFLRYTVGPDDYLLVRRRVANRLKVRVVGYEKTLVSREEVHGPQIRPRRAGKAEGGLVFL